MKQQLFPPEDIRLLRRSLCEDAERARVGSSEQCRMEWVDPHLWSQYMGEAGKRLYASYSDEELLDILRDTANELGHIPSQREIFCVYRSFIRRRFGNWPSALRVAGLKMPKSKGGIK